MNLLFDVVCGESELTQLERQDKSVRVIGEILPFVLARYGVASDGGRQVADRKASPVLRNVASDSRRDVVRPASARIGRNRIADLY